MAECRGLAPLARRHALVSTEVRRAGPVDIPFGYWLLAIGYCAQGAGAHGRICTDTWRVLSALSLPWTTWATGIADCRLQKWSAWEELHLQGSRFLRPAPLLFGANHTPSNRK